MKRRLAVLREKMQERQLGAVMISSTYNRRYLSGFTGTAGILIITLEKAFLITDFRYMEQAEKEAIAFEIVNHNARVEKTILQLLDSAAVKRLGFEDQQLTVFVYKKYKEALSNIDLVPIGNMIESIRAIKDPAEILTIKKAAEIIDHTFSHILSYIRPGVTEKEIELELEYDMKRQGARGPSFDTIVASGHRSALPHGVASEKKIESGDMVTLDFGAYYNGYCSDMTRTLAVGEPSAQLKSIYEIVLKAQLIGVEQIRSGMTGKEADALTRDIIKEAGYANEFGHGTGHGIGMEVHEAPVVSPRSNTVLQPGMVVTVEPGIYLSGVGGVRIEDDVIITEDGKEIITFSAKELLVL